jgi:hypothetical protein
MRLVVAASLFVLLASCAGSPDAAPQPAAAAGRGLVRADTAVPEGLASHACPEWRQGERFDLVRGDVVRGTLTIAEASPDGYVVDLGGGRTLRRDRDLGHLGEWSGDGQPMREMLPADVRYHWPLWVGKTWECEFVDRVRGGPSLPLAVRYTVEALDRVRVPAGEFDALRIVRSARLLVPGEDYLTRTQVVWYAPAIGVEVRQLLGESMVELVAHERPPAAADR